MSEIELKTVNTCFNCKYLLRSSRVDGFCTFGKDLPIDEDTEETFEERDLQQALFNALMDVEGCQRSICEWLHVESGDSLETAKRYRSSEGINGQEPFKLICDNWKLEGAEP